MTDPAPEIRPMSPEDWARYLATRDRETAQHETVKDDAALARIGLRDDANTGHWIVEQDSSGAWCLAFVKRPKRLYFYTERFERHEDALRLRDAWNADLARRRADLARAETFKYSDTACCDACATEHHKNDLHSAAGRTLCTTCFRSVNRDLDYSAARLDTPERIQTIIDDACQRSLDAKRLIWVASFDPGAEWGTGRCWYNTDCEPSTADRIEGTARAGHYMPVCPPRQ